MRNAECGIAHSELPSFETTFSHTSSPGWNGTRASTGIPNSVASSSAAFPTNGPPTMFSTTPSSVAFPSLAARSARRTASRGQELGQLLEALHAGREIHEQLVERAPGHIGQEFAQRRRLQGPPPHVSFGFRPPERQRSAILDEKCHGEAANAFCAHQRLDDAVVQRATGNGDAEELGSGGPVEIRVEDAGAPPRPRQCPGESGSHEALPYAALAAQHRDHSPYGSEPVGDT